jgi:Flp pilus assembly protein TadG
MGRSLRSSCSRRRGQSIVELAILMPFLALMLMGGFDASIMISDKINTVSAVRQGARLAAELGGSQTNPGSTTAQIDGQIVDNVLAMSSGLTSASVQEIDIYSPGRPDGRYQPGTDPVNQYFVGPGGSVTSGVLTFPIKNRKQSPPNETSIGIRLVWKYNAPAGIFPKNMILSDYAVMKVAPVLV